MKQATAIRVPPKGSGCAIRTACEAGFLPFLTCILATYGHLSTLSATVQRDSGVSRQSADSVSLRTWKVGGTLARCLLGSAAVKNEKRDKKLFSVSERNF